MSATRETTGVPAEGAIGQSPPRKEDWPLLTGEARFVGDVHLPGMLHAHILRSPLAHAEIAGSDAASALAHPDVEAIFTAADLPPNIPPIPMRPVGCEHGSCGACTVQLDGEPVRSCLMLAVQAHRRNVRTVESLAGDDGALHPLQEAFAAHYALQCGFCTAGFLMTAEALLRDARPGELDEDTIRAELSGNICRCTGYDPIVAVVRSLAI